MGEPTLVEIGGRQLRLTNLDKVLYPEVGCTKGEVVDYYVRVAPVMLAHLAGRHLTMKRYPDGVDGESFFQKRCPGHRPTWLSTAIGPGDAGRGIPYCVVEDVAGVVWAANLAALELHVPMALAHDPDSPTTVVFDLDPGAPAAMAQCAEVGLLIRELLSGLDLVAFPKTSGSKGLQLYVPLGHGHDFGQTRSFALAVAQLLERDHGSLVVSDMRRDLRAGKVLVDWSQNVPSKTTVCAYSLRARSRPTVSAPVTWEEVEAAAGGTELSFEASEVLARIDRLGDLFAQVTTLHQKLPASTQG